MERTASLLSLSSRASTRNGPDCKDNCHVLPYSEKPPQPRVPRIKAVLSHCLYKRVLVWAVASLLLVTLALSQSRNVSMSHVVEYAKSKATNVHPASNKTGIKTQGAGKDLSHDSIIVQPGDSSQKPTVDAQADELNREEDSKEREEFEKQANEKPWLRFPHLDGYFHGLKTLVKASDHVPEYPNTTDTAPLPAPPIKKGRLPKPVPYNPYNTAGNDVKACYLDKDNKIPAPDVYAYDGLPQHMPGAAIGSYDILGIRDDICFDRYGRLGPYGLGYEKEQGGSGLAKVAEDFNNERIWSKTGQINYTKVDWGDAQDRCSEANTHRLLAVDSDSGELPMSSKARKGKKARQAVVVRCYTDFKWTDLAVVNFRALVTELSLKSGGEYTIHILLHVIDNDAPIWADDGVVQRILDANILGISQLEFKDTYDNPSGKAIHGVYRSPHFPLQVFASQHPEYEYFWNWEMDLRYLGNYFELFDRIGRWADNQPRLLLWERSERYYIPSYHGSWDNFTKTVERDHVQSGKPTIFGPVDFDDRKPLQAEEQGQSHLPETCGPGYSPSECGVGEGADLITLDPIFDIAYSGWVFSNDVVGYKNPSYEHPPRRSSIVTAGRLSRRLLMSMHEEVWRHHRTMFSEMFPSTVALHHGLKAVYAPHPVFLDRAWTPIGSSVDAVFNGGRDHSTSGTGSPFYLFNEHNHKGTSFYYNSEFSGLLWRRWLGFAQMDGRGPFGGQSGGGTLRGGYREESRSDSSGRMCLRSMLLHPIKFEDPNN
ncbi:major facilitator superfamily transporter [Pochonia chlamydosporia 170]|uniref:Major facilitator superfamily transporter n=1 Tax=Pochonia chlamydosporia 170 TaxID=1380566 RepID=A0A179G3P0_METCM|nr:major facilitator superfamily transporter [Pochonia chlamydosporia 170]OAQ72100.2 major facilitator superfamily transporter [Pochonia chlamydosporia 170]